MVSHLWDHILFFPILLAFFFLSFIFSLLVPNLKTTSLNFFHLEDGFSVYFALSLSQTEHVACHNSHLTISYLCIIFFRVSIGRNWDFFFFFPNQYTIEEVRCHSLWLCYIIWNSILLTDGVPAIGC